MDDQEREALRDGTLRDLRRIVEALAAEKRPATRSWLKTVNGPFVVTVLGGLLITLVTILFQGLSASNQRTASQRESLYRRKQDLLTEFAGKFVLSAALAMDFKKRELWLVFHKDDPPAKRDELKYQDRRTFVESRNCYEEVRGEYLRCATAESLCTRIRATYDSEEVRRKASDLDLTMDKLIETLPATGADGKVSREALLGANRQLDDAYKAADTLYQELMTLMGEELRGMLR